MLNVIYLTENITTYIILTMRCKRLIYNIIKKSLWFVENVLIGQLKIADKIKVTLIVLSDSSHGMENILSNISQVRIAFTVIYHILVSGRGA